MHADFDNFPGTQLDFADQFDTDGSGVRFQTQLLQKLAPNQPEVAIDVAQANPEQQAGKAIVDAADADAVPRVVPLELVAVHQAYTGSQFFEQQRQFADVILAVTIGIKDQFFGGCGKAAAQRGPIAAVNGVLDDPHPRAIFGGQSAQDRACFILAAIVDYDHFEIDRTVGQH